MDGLYSSMIDVCVSLNTKDPVEIFRILVGMDGIPVNGKEHHVIVPLALVTAFWNASPDFDLRSYLTETVERASEVPQTICGYWGCCGSAVGTGIFYSVITKTNPLTRGKRWGLCNRMTSESLLDISEVGGPRCCKRNAVLSIRKAREFVIRELGIEMDISDFQCKTHGGNDVCIGYNCPFYIRSEDSNEIHT